MTELAVGMKVFSSQDNRTAVITFLGVEEATLILSMSGNNAKRKQSTLIPMTPAGYFNENRESALAESIKAGDVAILNTDNAVHGNGDVPQWEKGKFEEVYWAENYKCWKAYVTFPSYGRGWHGLLQELIMTSNAQSKYSLDNI